MARGLNHVLMVGALVQDPEMRYTPGGLAILELNLAGNDHVVGDDGKERELAWYHRATVFGGQAEMLADQLHAGDPVFLEGRVDYRTWESQDGQRRSALDVVATRVEAMTFGPRSGETTVGDAKGQQRLRGALNQVTLIGNLTRDAELRYTPSGAAVARFGMAVNDRFRDKSGQDQERTHFVDINVWRELAEGCAELSKGDPVLVSGRLVNDSWTDRDGNRRFTTRIEGSRVEFLTRGPGGGGTGTRGGPASQSREDARGAQAGQERRLDIDDEFPPEEDLPF